MINETSYSRSTRRAAWRRIVSIAGAAVTAGHGLCLLPADAQDLSFKDFPYVVYCEYEGVVRAFYFSRLDGDGIAVYLTPD